MRSRCGEYQGAYHSWNSLSRNGLDNDAALGDMWNVSSLTRSVPEVQCGRSMGTQAREGVTAVQEWCVALDTKPHKRVRAAVRLVVLLIIGFTFRGTPTDAQDSEALKRNGFVPLDAKVVWAASDRAVLASRDSLTIEELDALLFFDHKKEVASGVVTRIFEPGVVAARLRSGSLDKVKKLDHIRVFVSRTQTAPALVRIGYPSARRSNALFRCGSVGFGIHPYYRPGSTDLRHFLRDWSDEGPLPDTLAVQEFDESGDEEIAFERGELDIAIFWPGELSSSERDHLDPTNHLLALRKADRVAATFVPSKSSGAHGAVLVDRAGLESMNRDLFGGDLALEDGIRSASDAMGTKSYEAMTRVDRGCPGWQALERKLNTSPRPLTTTAPTGSIRVFYTSDPKADSTTTRLFRVRCPVLFHPSLRRVLDRLRGDRLVDLIECRPSEDGR